MRKHSVRKWLHAILDLLPVILIPVFMVYSHRHAMTEQTQVDIQYKYESNEITETNDIIKSNIYSISRLNFQESNQFEDYYLVLHIFKCDKLTINSQNSYLDEFFVENYDSKNSNFIEVTLTYSSTDLSISLLCTNLNAYSFYQYEEVIDIYLENSIISFEDFNNLQQLDTILDYFGNPLPQYTDYNVIEDVQVEDTNSSVTNVFMNNFTNTVDTYFNFNNTFNLGDIWTWIDTNLFSGNSPSIAFSIWNIICYEFLMDLLFVFYAFFMFLMDFVEFVLEKPFNRINRR